MNEFKKPSRLKNVPTTTSSSSQPVLGHASSKSALELAAPKMLEVLKKLRSDLIADDMRAGAFHRAIIEDAIQEAEGRKS